MSTLVSVRLDDNTGVALKRLVRKTGLTRSEIIRQAVVLLSERDPDQDPAARPHEALADLIGCVRGGPADLSSRTGEKFRKIVDKKKARRP